MEIGCTSIAHGPRQLLDAGGAALAPVQTGSMRAAEEAASGAWLQELERPGGLPKALAPGMTRGVFGAWQRPGDCSEESVAHRTSMHGLG